MQLSYRATKAAVIEMIAEAHAEGKRPRLHPNGFIQLNLDHFGATRFHVWPEKPLEAQKTSHPIHDHSFAMESTILLGCLENRIYKTVPFDFERTGYTLWQAQRIGANDTVLNPLGGGFYCLNLVEERQYKAGESYAMRDSMLHESVAHGLTATVMQKLTNLSVYNPIIAVPGDIAKPDNDYRRESVSPEILWEQITLAASKIKGAL